MSPLDRPEALVLLALAFVGLVVWFRHAWQRARRDRAAELVWAEALAGPVRTYTPEAPVPSCWLDRCDNPDPDTWVYSRNTGWLLVCRKCAHEGAAHGWWIIPDGARGA